MPAVPQPDGTRTIRVVLGEDDFIAREGIARLVESLDGFELAAACDDLPSLRRPSTACAPTRC